MSQKMVFSNLAVVKDAASDSHADEQDARRHPSLRVQLRDGFSFEGSLTDLDETIRLARKAADTTPENHPDRAWRLYDLRIRLNARYSRTGAIADLEEGIQLARQILNLTSKDHPNRAGLLNGLANRLSDRYLRTGAIADLEESIQVGKQAIDAAPEWHPKRAMYLNDLGAPFGDRYKRTGAIADLEEAIRLMGQAVDMTPENDPLRALYLSNLGCQLYDRYFKIRAMADLEESIRFARQAVNATSNHFDRAGRLHNLGHRLGIRYSRTGTTSDLEEAIQIARQIVDMVPKDNPNWAMYLGNLGAQLKSRYSRTGEEADLEESIEIGRQIIGAIPKDHKDQARQLYDLGNKLLARYVRTGDTADLEESIRITRQAVNATSEDHPDQADLLQGLGAGLMKRFRKTRVRDDLDEATVCFKSALHRSNGDAIRRIKAGHVLLLACRITSDWQQAYEAANVVVRLISKLLSRSLENSDKQHVLTLAVGLASDAAAAALQAGKGALAALNFLEQGRGVLATSLEEMRTDILDLRERCPELADQFVRLRDELELSATTLDEDHVSSWKTRGSRRYDAGNELDEVIIEIRKQPGFEEFLTAPSVREMQAAAMFGPIVVINVSKYRCDAVLVEEHQVRALALPNLNSIEIKKMAQRGSLGSPMVLKWLWDVAANPILDTLGFVQPPSADNWPHVWWIPTGPLSKFPLHAAGRHSSGSNETVLDRVMSSYSPSIKAIIQGRRRRIAPSTPAQALLVAMQDTPENSRLPFAVKEIAMLRDLCGQMGCNPVEPGRRKQDIMPHLPDCKIFHFAGHGHSDNRDPSQSFLLLEDWKNDPLTVATLLETNLRKHPPFLAYLSACGTGQIKQEKLVDESIHLISACQLAGFRHVIGTLWDVNDDLCVDMARITYEGMRDGGMTDESVCRGLHKATRELRDRWVSMATNARHVSIRVREASVPQTGVRSASDGDPRSDKLSRDVVLCDDDDDGEIASLHWVPYVHFGA
ncbi:CHAT domain-containing protein [Leptodontidium sp. MPI-SDFR-AT-0119]|nr:CHAT domain-containing protein [Leptodontidium sp. MPI-SDFR-AT-0119]